MEDLVGKKTLDIMAQAKNYNIWLFKQILPWLSSPVAEIGAGTGTFIKLLRTENLSITAIDMNLRYLTNIKKNNPGVKTIEINMEKPVSPHLHGKFSSVIALNVIEHINDDFQAIKNIFALLRPSGYAVILVPAHKWVYGTLDKNLHHVRRYDSGSLTRLIESGGFSLVKLSHLNFLGLIGWWLNGILFRRPIIPGSQLRIFDCIFLPFLTIERHIPLPVGLSLLVVVKKP